MHREIQQASAEEVNEEKEIREKMNRQQAEHLLDAYVRMRIRESDKDASDALHEVILDAMTEYRYTGITYPYATWNEQTKTYKPIVTCEVS